MEQVAALICGDGYRPNWSAISAVATIAAVLVALWIPLRDRRRSDLLELERQARAASIVAHSLSGLIEVMPDVVQSLRDKNGVILDVPGNAILYGTDQCRAILEKQGFVHQLPSGLLGPGELTLSLARTWIDEIDKRFQIQRDERLRGAVDWKDCTFIASIGERLHASAKDLKTECNRIYNDYQHKKTPAHKRLLARLGQAGRPVKAGKSDQQSAAADAVVPRAG